MNLLNTLHRMKSLIRYIKGIFYNYLFFSGKAKGLRVASNVDLSGKIKLGRNIYISQGVKIYKNNEIKDYVYLGDNVELRNGTSHKITIDKNCTINRGSIIIGNVNIGKNCLIAPLCVIAGANHNFSDLAVNTNQQGASSKGISLCNNVWIGAQVIILDGVVIGENCIIGAGSVVTKNIPKNSIAVGNPCQVIKKR